MKTAKETFEARLIKNQLKDKDERTGVFVIKCKKAFSVELKEYPTAPVEIKEYLKNEEYIFSVGKANFGQEDGEKITVWNGDYDDNQFELYKKGDYYDQINSMCGGITISFQDFINHFMFIEELAYSRIKYHTNPAELL